MIAKLPRQTEEEIQRLVEPGAYDDSTDVLVKGVHLLSQQWEQTAHLRALLQVGIDQYERGETHEFTPELRDQLWEEARQRHAAGDKPSPDVCP